MNIKAEYDSVIDFIIESLIPSKHISDERLLLVVKLNQKRTQVYIQLCEIFKKYQTDDLGFDHKILTNNKIGSTRFCSAGDVSGIHHMCEFTGVQSANETLLTISEILLKKIMTISLYTGECIDLPSIV